MRCSNFESRKLPSCTIVKLNYTNTQIYTFSSLQFLLHPFVVLYAPDTHIWGVETMSGLVVADWEPFTVSNGKRVGKMKAIF